MPSCQTSLLFARHQTVGGLPRETRPANGLWKANSDAPWLNFNARIAAMISNKA
jgi:hypothetical protein